MLLCLFCVCVLGFRIQIDWVEALCESRVINSLISLLQFCAYMNYLLDSITGSCSLPHSVNSFSILCLLTTKNY